MGKNVQFTKSLKHCRQCFIVDIIDKPLCIYVLLENVFWKRSLHVKREKVTWKWSPSHPELKLAGAVVKEICPVQTRLLVANSMNSGISQMLKALSPRSWLPGKLLTEKRLAEFLYRPAGSPCGIFYSAERGWR